MLTKLGRANKRTHDGNLIPGQWLYIDTLSRQVYELDMTWDKLAAWH